MPDLHWIRHHGLLRRVASGKATKILHILHWLFPIYWSCILRPPDLAKNQLSQFYKFSLRLLQGNSFSESFNRGQILATAWLYPGEAKATGVVHVLRELPRKRTKKRLVEKKEASTEERESNSLNSSNSWIRRSIHRRERKQFVKFTKFVDKKEASTEKRESNSLNSWIRRSVHRKTRKQFVKFVDKKEASHIPSKFSIISHFAGVFSHLISPFV